jgi:hypothetical protein
MPSREIDALREAVRYRVQGSTLRAIAAEIGMPHQTLHAFIQGSDPYGKNLGLLRTWYAKETNETVRLRQEVEELKRKLAACEAKLRKGR